MKNVLVLICFVLSLSAFAATESILCTQKKPLVHTMTGGMGFVAPGMSIVVDIVDGKAGNAYWIRGLRGVMNSNNEYVLKSGTSSFKENISDVDIKKEVMVYETYPPQTVVETRYAISLQSDGKAAGTLKISMDVNNGVESGSASWRFPQMSQKEDFAHCTRKVTL